jgi:hypothetical protein
MSIIRNIQNNMVVIYEIKYFYVILPAEKLFLNNIHRANYYFTNSKKIKKIDNTTTLLFGGIILLCTVKDLSVHRVCPRRRASVVVLSVSDWLQKLYGVEHGIKERELTVRPGPGTRASLAARRRRPARVREHEETSKR